MPKYRFFIGMSWNKGGLSQHLQALVDALVARGHEVVVIADQKKTKITDVDGNPRRYTWPSKRPIHLRDARFLHSLIRQYPPDCVIANFGSSNLMTVVSWAAKVPTRMIWYRTISRQAMPDNTQPVWRHQLSHWRKQLVYKLTTHVLANSYASKADVQAVYGVADQKCVVAYNSLMDPLTEQLQDLEPNRNYVVCVGRLFPSKGQDVLIDAMAMLKPEFPELRIAFLGDGPSKDALLQQAQRLGVAENCQFSGSVEYPMVLRELRLANFSIVPSHSEAFGMVNIESHSVGTPVIASNIEGCAEIVRDGIDGCLFPPGDSRALADKMRLLLTNAELRTQMSENARQRFLTTFERSKIVETLASQLESIVEATYRRK